MSNLYSRRLSELAVNPRKWLVTGVAGFIGSNILETLLRHNQVVVGLDNFSTGYQKNLDAVQDLVGVDAWANFTFVEGDIRDFGTCSLAVRGVRHVLHQAALGSVPRSLEDPVATNSSNVSGFLNMLVASREANVGSFTYAASSSTYGDHEALPKVEHRIGNPLSPYAITKFVNELYANVFASSYGFGSVGLRYFNVFGPRQDPDGAYAAVIPRWISELLRRRPPIVNGDGETSRDFCFVSNAVQANILSVFASDPTAATVYNVAVGDRTSLNSLYDSIQEALIRLASIPRIEPSHSAFRLGDVRHSQASIEKIKAELGYLPEVDVAEGVARTCEWFVRQFELGAI